MVGVVVGTLTARADPHTHRRVAISPPLSGWNALVRASGVAGRSLVLAIATRRNDPADGSAALFPVCPLLITGVPDSPASARSESPGLPCAGVGLTIRR